VKIKWLGHAAFLITSESGVRIINDPYKPEREIKLGRIDEAADVVTISHGHGDHSNAADVRGNPQVIKTTAEAKGIKFRAVRTFHDEAKGREHGGNTVFCFTVDGVNICHLGDIGHVLTPAQLAEVGRVDVLILPVGGFFTIAVEGASRLCDQLKPKVIIPMHFRNEQVTMPIAGVDEFLKGKPNISRPDSSEVEFKADKLPAATQIIVLKPAL
jgi:L-ascorbate metabolism protein UlaG (beta-lactamase superfamily)